ncbi:MAG: acyl carrier protein [Candidatus Paceibacterota bacterium]|jgi:acyl carrier protein
MKQSEILKRITIILIKKLNRAESEITLSAIPIMDLGADSLDLVEIVMEIEAAFGIKISDEEVGGGSTIQDIVNLIEKKLSKEGDKK